MVDLAGQWIWDILTRKKERKKIFIYYSDKQGLQHPAQWAYTVTLNTKVKYTKWHEPNVI